MGWLAALRRPLAEGEFDRFIDEQGRDEQAGFRSYREITARSLALFGVAPDEADRIGAGVGRWPLFADSAEGMRRLQALAPCVATTNSDRTHGEQVQEQLGLRLAGWISADEARSYKPALAHWEEASRRMKVDFGPAWWHVSAYGDYDLSVARRLGLTWVVPATAALPAGAARRGGARSDRAGGAGRSGLSDARPPIMRRWLFLFGVGLLGSCAAGPLDYAVSTPDYADYDYGPYYYGHGSPGNSLLCGAAWLPPRARLSAPAAAGYGYRMPSYQHAPPRSYGRAAPPAGHPSAGRPRPARIDRAGPGRRATGVRQWTAQTGAIQAVIAGGP